MQAATKRDKRAKRPAKKHVTRKRSGGRVTRTITTTLNSPPLPAYVPKPAKAPKAAPKWGPDGDEGPAVPSNVSPELRAIMAAEVASTNSAGARMPRGAALRAAARQQRAARAVAADMTRGQWRRANEDRLAKEVLASIFFVLAAVGQPMLAILLRPQ